MPLSEVAHVINIALVVPTEAVIGNNWHVGGSCFGLMRGCHLCAGELHGSPLARLSLETLGSFNFGPISLLEFAREHVLQWLDDADISVRKAAALCAARILNRHVTETKRPVRHLVRCYTVTLNMASQRAAAGLMLT